MKWILEDRERQEPDGKQWWNVRYFYLYVIESKAAAHYQRLVKVNMMTHLYLLHLKNACEIISHPGYHDWIAFWNFKPQKVVGTVGTRLFFYYRQYF